MTRTEIIIVMQCCNTYERRLKREVRRKATAIENDLERQLEAMHNESVQRAKPIVAALVSQAAYRTERAYGADKLSTQLHPHLNFLLEINERTALENRRCLYISAMSSVIKKEVSAIISEIERWFDQFRVLLSCEGFGVRDIEWALQYLAAFPLASYLDRLNYITLAECARKLGSQAIAGVPVSLAARNLVRRDDLPILVNERS